MQSHLLHVSVSRITVRKLDKSRLKSWARPFTYESESYYDLECKKKPDGWSINLRRKQFPKPFKKCLIEEGIQDYKNESEIYVAEIDGKEAGWLQIEHQEWNNSLRVWDVGVEEKFMRQGVGAELMDSAKARAKSLGARRIILETQTSNSKAIAFYLSQGFELVGMDITSYTNDDTAKKEVRLEMAYHLPQNAAKTPKHRARGKNPAKRNNG
jgi:ribosomal protein S18 acetylase RimI-like enzyme